MPDGTTNDGSVIGELGANDILVGTELFRTLKMTSGDMTDPQKFHKMREITKFLNEHPDPLFIIGSVTRSNNNPNRENLDHLFDFVQLTKEKGALSDKLDNINNELKLYG